MESSPDSFHDLLDPGEKLLWSGQSMQGLLLQVSDFFPILSGLIWLGMSGLFTVASAASAAGTKSGKPPVIVLLFLFIFVFAFVCGGLHMVIGRFFFDAAVRRKTFYLLTNRRVIVQKNYFGRQSVSLDLALLPAITLHEWKDNSGDIIFGTPTSMWAVIFKSNWNGKTWNPTPGFYYLKDARQVHARIRAAQAEARRVPTAN